MGKLRLGYKDPDRGFPRRSEWFIPDFDDPEMQETFEGLYGDKPTKIPVTFASADQDEAFPQWYKCYGSGSGLKCRGDGEKAGRASQENPDEFIEVDCLGPDACEFANANGSHGKPGCGVSATLSFFIKKLPAMQIVQVSTTSKNSLMNVNSGLFLLRQLCERTGQSPFGMWVDLILKPQDSIVSGQKTKIYVLDLVIPGSLEDFAAVEAPVIAPQLSGPESPAPPDVVETGPGERDGASAPPSPASFSPEVEAAMKSMGISDIKREALEATGWSDKRLLEAIGWTGAVTSSPATASHSPQPNTTSHSNPVAPEQEGIEF